MKAKYKFVLFLLLLTVAIGTLVAFLGSHDIAVLSPKGEVASKERNLMIIALALGVLVVIPVFAMTIMIAWKYREGNKSAKYTPEWDHNNLAEFTWWAIPSAIILVLSAVTWTSSHALDPYKPLEASARPMTIQVVALQWKWLFIYPEQHVATVNYVEFPEQTPIDFEITSDAPMNSFWIPQLGGQVYAMAGMTTHLHLMADGEGSYSGSSANLSGKGFAGMTFTAKSSSNTDFGNWVSAAQNSSNQLTLDEYNKLSAPSEDNPGAVYGLSDTALYDRIVMKFTGQEPSH